MRSSSITDTSSILGYRAAMLARVGAAIGLGAAGYAWIVQGERQR